MLIPLHICKYLECLKWYFDAKQTLLPDNHLNKHYFIGAFCLLFICSIPIHVCKTSAVSKALHGDQGSRCSADLSSLQTFCRYSADILQTFCRYSAYHLQRICRSSADLLHICQQICSRLKTDLPVSYVPILKQDRKLFLRRISSVIFFLPQYLRRGTNMTAMAVY